MNCALEQERKCLTRRHKSEGNSSQVSKCENTFKSQEAELVKRQQLLLGFVKP